MFPLYTHLMMLEDQIRMRAYRRAIFDAVPQGAVVADIGTGTGILAYFAAQAGAGKVYAIESGPIIDVARKTADENGFSGCIRFIQGNSLAVDIPEPVDVLITETVGCFGIEEGIMETVHDARRRFLKHDGIIIPKRVALMAMPVGFEKQHPYAFLQESFFGLKTSHLAQLASNTVFGIKPEALMHAGLLARPAQLFEADLYECGPAAYPLRMNCEFRITRAGEFHGMVTFPQITLADDIDISLFQNGKPVPTHWEFTFFPNREKVRLSEADRLMFALSLTEQNGYLWENRVTRNGRTDIFSHLSLFGSPSLTYLKQDLSKE
jgi:protein arginine N-methyltransferase 1